MSTSEIRVLIKIGGEVHEKTLVAARLAEKARESFDDVRGRVADLLVDLGNRDRKVAELEAERDRLLAQLKQRGEEAAAVRGRVAEIVREMDTTHSTVAGLSTIREWGERLMRALSNAS